MAKKNKKIKKKNEDVILEASSHAVETHMTDLITKCFANREILNLDNRYYFDAIRKIQDYKHFSSKASLKSKRYNELADYISASTIQHTFDSWNYISHGTNAVLNGDINTGIHLIYYGEVRAVMAIFANEGIGIFRDLHFFIDKKNRISSFGTGTHTVLHNLLQLFDEKGRNKDNLASCISWSGKSLIDFIDFAQMNTSGSFASRIFNDWIKDWICDLNLSSDSNLRNKTSYRPNFKFHPIDKDTIEKILRIWGNLGPTGLNRFEDIDFLLIRLSLWKAFMSNYSGSSRVKDYRIFMQKILQDAGISITKSKLKEWQKIPSKTENIIIAESTRDIKSRSINLKEPIPILCRAILLARLATGLTKRLLENAGVVKPDLDFWWQDLAIQFGFMLPGIMLNDASDLHSDVKETIDAVLIPHPFNITQFHQANGNDLNKFHQFQRVAFWGLGL